MIQRLSTLSSETIQSQQTFTNLFSITKELIENSLDAESTLIKVFIDNLSIKIEDNGIGINTIEKIGIEGFTTKSEQTHYVLGEKPKPKFSFGFRGQAIFLLRKICDIEIISREASVPYALKYNLSKNTEISKTSKEPGTTVIISNIFKNCPIRRKIFYSQISKDTEKLISLFKSYCIVYKTDIKLFLKNKLIMNESGIGNIKEYAKINFADHFTDKNSINENKKDICMEASESNSYIEFENEICYFLISKIPSVSLESFIFADLRPVKSKKITKQICQIFNNFSSNFPIFFLKIKEDTDVNVSADKTDFVLPNENNIFNILKDIMERNLSLYKYVSPVIGNYEIDKQEYKEISKDASRNLFTPGCTYKYYEKDLNTNTFVHENLEKYISTDSLETAIFSRIDENKEKSDKKNYKISEKNIFSRILKVGKEIFNNKKTENKKTEISNVLNEKSLNKVNNKKTENKKNEISNVLNEKSLNKVNNKNLENKKTNIFNSSTNEYEKEENYSSSTEKENIYIPPPNHNSEDNIYNPASNLKTEDNYNNNILQKDLEQTETPNPFYIEKQKNVFLHFDDPVASSLNSKIILSKKDFLQMKIIGQFNCGFILTELIKENYKYLIIIDQHAADEIKNYEFLKNNFYLKKQRLIVPLTLKLDSLEEFIVKSYKSVINRNGFDLNNDLKIISVPIYKNQIFGKNDFYEILNKLKNTNQSEKYIFCDRIKNIMASKACRQSIMIGDVLSYKQMEEIVRNLANLNIPWNCPHGRPTTRVLCVFEHKNTEL